MDISLTPIERFFRYAAPVVSAISAYFTYQFAYSTMQDPWLGNLLGIALAICCFAAGYVWLVRSAAINMGVSPNVAACLLVAGLIFSGTDALTNAGSLLWQRAASDNAATFQNTRYELSEKEVGRLNERIEFFDKRAKDLDAEMTSLVSTKVGDWSVTTRPSSAAELDGMIVAKTRERDNEAARGGCGDLCEERNDELAHLIALQGKAKAIEDNAAQHAAALAALAKASAEMADRPTVVSSTNSQNEVLSKLFSVATLSPTLKPTADSQQWTGLVVGLFLAVFLTFGPMSMNWIGFGGWRGAKLTFEPDAPKADHESTEGFQYVSTEPVEPTQTEKLRAIIERMQSRQLSAA